MSVNKSESDGDGDATGTPGHVEFVRVHLGGESYVFELGRVSSLVRSPSLTRVPRTSPIIAGVTETQGDVTAVIDGRALLGADDQRKSLTGDDQRKSLTGDDHDGALPRILVVFAEIAHDQTAGMLVDGIEGIETHPVDVIAPASADGTGPDDPESDWFKAIIDGKTWVFDPEKLIEAARSGSQQVN